MSDTGLTVTMVGAGKVGRQLAFSLTEGGANICQVFNRTLSKARSLTDHVGGESIDQFSNISAESDLFLIAVKDDAIPNVIRRLAPYVPRKSVIAHTSGQVSMTCFENEFTRFGVFYPLQTFNDNAIQDIGDVPICINANNEVSRNRLHDYARVISDVVVDMNDEQRAKVHLPAVFANNFVTFLNHIAYDLCQKNDLSFELLYPLIRQTSINACQGLDPGKYQTGPAIRHDKTTIRKHREGLHHLKDYRLMYEYITRAIQKNLS